MVIKRIPLFIAGLLYGAVINSTVLGFGYGVYAAGAAIVAILGCFCNSDAGLVAAADGPEGIIGLAIIAGIIIAAAAVVGLAIGVLYGLFAGSWHCAMDFYNNGLSKGLSSPFRFLSAKWSKDIDNNAAPLREYYHSTDVNFLANKQVALEVIERRAETIHQVLDQENGNFPKELSQIIAGYSISSEDIGASAGMHGNVANFIERSVLGEDKTEHTKSEANFFTDNEVLDIVNKHPFFSRGTKSSRLKGINANQPDANTAELIHFPPIKQTLQLLRRGRY